MAGVLKLKANQNITLWIKSKSAGTWELSEDSSCSVILAHVENNFHSSGFQAVLNPLISQSVTGATSWKLIRSWVTSRNDGQAGPFNLGKKLNMIPFQCLLHTCGCHFESSVKHHISCTLAVKVYFILIAMQL